MSGPFNEHDDPKAEFWYKLRSAVAVILSLAVLVGGCVFVGVKVYDCLLYTSPSPRDVEESRMPSSA